MQTIETSLTMRLKRMSSEDARTVMLNRCARRPQARDRRAYRMLLPANCFWICKPVAQVRRAMSFRSVSVIGSGTGLADLCLAGSVGRFSVGLSIIQVSFWSRDDLVQQIAQTRHSHQ